VEKWRSGELGNFYWRDNSGKEKRGEIRYRQSELGNKAFEGLLRREIEREKRNICCSLAPNRQPKTNATEATGPLNFLGKFA